MPKTQTRRLSAYCGFDLTEEQYEEIRRRAERDGRPVASWMRRRLDLLFEIDDRLMQSRHALSQSPQT